MREIKKRISALERLVPEPTGKKYRIKIDGKILIVDAIPEFLKPDFKGYEH